MPLSDTAIRNAKPKDKPYKLADEKGLYALIQPTGGKLWRLDYRFENRRKTLALGQYPDVSLSQARQRREDARKQLAQGIDPGAAKQAAKLSAVTDSFEAIAREWHAKFSPSWTPAHAERIFSRLERDIFPHLGQRPIGEITAPELLAVLRRIEARGALNTAHRAHADCGQIFRYSVATGRAQRDPSGDLKGALPPARAKHHASITDPKMIGDLLRAFDGYQGSFVVKCALRLAPLVFVRPGELRNAEWTEIDLEKAEWRIPAGKMKMRDPHIVPLSRQAVEVFKEIHSLTGTGRYVFPSARSPRGDRPMSENAVLAALRRLGYGKGEMTGHGVRSMASTLLNEQGWHRDAIERQLAHAERSAVRAAYNYAEHLPERVKMLQWWADYLDGLRQGATVLPFRKPA